MKNATTQVYVPLLFCKSEYENFRYKFRVLSEQSVKFMRTCRIDVFI